MNLRRSLAAGSAMLTMCVSGVAEAGIFNAKANPALEAIQVNFQSCDGYGAPQGKGDGITGGTWLFGLARSNEDIRPGMVSALAQKGVEACEKALADPVLLPDFAVRRAHLLQGKAFHQISALAYDDALKSLDAVDAMRDRLGPVYFDRGVGLGDRLLRAFIFIEQGRKAEAAALLDTVDRERAYSASVRRVTERLRYRLDPDIGSQLARYRAMAPVVPSLAVAGFLLALEDARMEEALAIGAAVSFDRPVSKGRWKLEGDAAHDDYRRIQTEAMYAGAYAYAQLAAGRGDAAAATLARARAGLEEATLPPPPRPDGQPVSKKVQLDYDMRVHFARFGKTELDNWENLIAVRRAAPTMTLAMLSDRLGKLPRGSIPVVVDLIGQLGLAGDYEKQGVLADIRLRQQKARELQFGLDVYRIADILPRPETEAGQVRLKRAGDGMFLSDNGYSLRAVEDDPTSWTVRFTHALATMPTLEEYAMLAAASAAKDKGYDGLLVQNQLAVERTTHMTGWGGGYDMNSGREAQLRVRMLHRSALPAELVGSEWRVLDVDKVITDLSGLPRRQT